MFFHYGNRAPSRGFRIYRAVRTRRAPCMVYISEIWIFAYFRSNSAVGHMGFWHVSISRYIFWNNSPLRDYAAIKIWRSNTNFKLIPSRRLIREFASRVSDVNDDDSSRIRTRLSRSTLLCTARGYKKKKKKKQYSI